MARVLVLRVSACARAIIEKPCSGLIPRARQLFRSLRALREKFIHSKLQGFGFSSL